METKVIILGENKEEKTLKKIVFTHVLSANNTIKPINFDPSRYKNIELICKNNGGLDIMFAYDYIDMRNDGKGELFLGHFNDGIV